MRTEIGKMKLQDARRDLIEIQDEYFKRKTNVVYLLLVERLLEIKDRAQELAKEQRLDELDELHRKLQVLR